jgi:Rrf2 family nitric oxide-sensitive transcriptional repressor
VKDSPVHRKAAPDCRVFRGSYYPLDGRNSTPGPTFAELRMRLTRFTDNALRCLIYLGSSEQVQSTVGEVARRMSMSEDHLLKVVKRLSQLGYVRTTRGRKGGLRLATDPSAINIAAVIRATEDNLAIVPCFESGHQHCPIAPACGLAPALEEALNSFFTTLGKYTLQDFLNNAPQLRQAIEIEEQEPTAV